jgi:hypothetical protein
MTILLGEISFTMLKEGQKGVYLKYMKGGKYEKVWKGDIHFHFNSHCRMGDDSSQ